MVSAGSLLSHPPRVGFVLEQSLGHVTFARNLQSALAGDARLSPVWMPVAYSSNGTLGRVPVVHRNWAVRGSLRAQALVRAHGGADAFDALLYHTQTVGLLSSLTARRTPVILSLDATPINFDSIGAYYQHRSEPGSRIEAVKRLIYRRVFAGATALTTWSQWAKNSLRDDYGVDPEHVTVIPPGVDASLFPFGVRSPAAVERRRPRALFVGADFERKGGPLLLTCMRAGLADQCELHVVTTSPVVKTPGVVVHHGLGPNDPDLLALYRDADIFVLPTYADCLGVVLVEAMAAGLPVVTTSVAAVPEIVETGRSGVIVPPGDEQALGRALARLVGDPNLRRAMGRRGRTIAEERFDAQRNSAALVDVVLAGIDHRRARRSAERSGGAGLTPAAEEPL